MNAQDAIERLAIDPNDMDALQELERAVADASKTGYGEQGDNLIDWLVNGDYSDNPTVQQIADEWDADRD